MKLALPGSLLGVSVVLAAAIGYELLAPLGPTTIDAQRAPVLRPAAPISQVAPPSIDLFADIDARPLFNPRRTPLPDSGLPGSASGSTSDLTLIGVMIGGDKPIALLKSASASTTTSATIGDIVAGLRVVQIAPTQVSLRGASGLVVIPLANLGSQAPSAPLPAPVAANTTATPAPSQSETGSPPPAAVPPPQAAAKPAAAPAIVQAAAPAAKPATPIVAATPPAVTVSAKPGLPAVSANGTISAEALKGAPIDPKTGQPTL
jgi:hypothetical protein